MSDVVQRTYTPTAETLRACATCGAMCQPMPRPESPDCSWCFARKSGLVGVDAADDFRTRHRSHGFEEERNAIRVRLYCPQCRVGVEVSAC